MPSAASDAVRGFRARNLGLIVPALMATSILVIVVPLPAALLDLLLSANITVDTRDRPAQPPPRPQQAAAR